MDSTPRSTAGLLSSDSRDATTPRSTDGTSRSADGLSSRHRLLDSSDGASQCSSKPGLAVTKGSSRTISRGEFSESKDSAKPRYVPLETDGSHHASMSSTWDIPGQRQALSVMFCTRINILLLFVPLSMMNQISHSDVGIVFGSNFLALVPLAHIMSGSMNSLTKVLGNVRGSSWALLTANGVEIIMCIQLIHVGLPRMVQGLLLGSILSNMLLVLGLAICASGMVRHDQRFNAKSASSNMSCLMVACCSVCFPTVYRIFSPCTAEDLNDVSRICALFLLACYGMFLAFVLRTHTEMFKEERQAQEDPVLNPVLSLCLLLLSGWIALTFSHTLIEAIPTLSSQYKMSKAFISVILLPLCGNAAEYVHAVHYAYAGMMDLVLAATVGSSLQIALFVIPISILYGWACNEPMNLAFRDFDLMCMVLTVFLVSQVLQHGNTNWLHGSMLITVYMFIAVQTCYINEAL